MLRAAQEPAHSRSIGRAGRDPDRLLVCRQTKNRWSHPGLNTGSQGNLVNKRDAALFVQAVSAYPRDQGVLKPELHTIQ